MNTAEKRIIKKHATLEDVIKMLETVRNSSIDWSMPSSIDSRLSVGYVFNTMAKGIASIKVTGLAKTKLMKAVMDKAIDEFGDYMLLAEKMYQEITACRAKQTDAYMKRCRLTVQEPMSIDEFNELFK